MAAFTPATPTAVAADYTSTVAWGTGSAAFTTTGTIASDGGSGFVVTTQAAASHFAAAGSMAFSVRVTHTASAFTGARSGTATILSSAPFAPNPVTGLTATLSTDGTSAALAWTPTSGASSLIRRSADGGATWQTLAMLAPGVGSFTDPVLAGNTNYTYSVTARTNASDSSSAAESAPALAIATTPDTGILGGGQAFVPGVTDGNSSNTDGGLTYSGSVGTESLTAADQSSYPNFKASKFAGLFSNGDVANFTFNGDMSAIGYVKTSFVFGEVIDSTDTGSVMTEQQVADSLTINGNPLASAASTSYTVHALGTAPLPGYALPDSQSGVANSCIAYKAMAMFSVSAAFASASNAFHVLINGLPGTVHALLGQVTADAEVKEEIVATAVMDDPKATLGVINVKIKNPKGEYIVKIVLPNGLNYGTEVKGNGNGEGFKRESGPLTTKAAETKSRFSVDNGLKAVPNDKEATLVVYRQSADESQGELVSSTVVPITFKKK